MSKSHRAIDKRSLQRKPPRDYDPEDDIEFSEENSGSESDGVEVNAQARDHYEKVGKSKLRKLPTVKLDATKYGGAPISRKSLRDSEESSSPIEGTISEEDDPFATSKAGAFVASDSDEDEQHADGFESNEESYSDVKDDGLNNDGNESGSEPEDEDIEDELSGSDVELGIDEDDAGDDSEDEDEDEDGSNRRLTHRDRKSGDVVSSQAREDLKAILQNQAKALATNLSQAATSDVKKGQAVKKQYESFDRLLDARMKMQKGLLASEELTTAKEVQDNALASVEQATFRLLNTMNGLREVLLEAASASEQKKRKRNVAEVFSTKDAWSMLEEQERAAKIARKSNIDKWSGRLKASDPTLIAQSTKPKLFSNSSTDRLTTILDTYVLNEQEKLLRADSQHLDHDMTDIDTNNHAPRTNGSALNHSLKHYEDSTFYQSLLRELIASRSRSSTTISQPLLPLKLHPSGNKQNKSTRDTKASKGRKIRYTVHEKLQNFMAAEGNAGRDTAMWTERGKDEFFGSLFGQNRALNEVEELEQDDDNAEVEALRLFR